MRSEAVDKEVIHSLEVYGIHESFARHLVSLLAVLTSLRGDDPRDSHPLAPWGLDSLASPTKISKILFDWNSSNMLLPADYMIADMDLT